MSKVWDAIKKVERERELADRRGTGESDHPTAVYLSGVRRRCQDRFIYNQPRRAAGANKP